MQRHPAPQQSAPSSKTTHDARRVLQIVPSTQDRTPNPLHPHPAQATPTDHTAQLKVHPKSHKQKPRESSPEHNTDPPQEEAEAFDVEGALNRLQIRPRIHNDQSITIFTLNMDGLRTKYKKESLKALAHHLQFTVGIITETHLLDPEVDALAVPDYLILDKMGSSKHRGGVLILARATAPCRKFTQTTKPPETIDTCSIILYPTGIEDYAIQITGVYIPPSAQATGEQLSLLTQPGCQAFTRQGSAISHLLIGDFNPNCWADKGGMQYQEWLSDLGLWGLSDPSLPTYITGS